MSEASNWVVGVDVGGTKLKIALFGEKGEIVQEWHCPTKAQEKPILLMEDIKKGVEEVARRANRVPVALGIGMAGQIDGLNGIVTFAPNLPLWKNVPLKQDLETMLEIPVIITNDVRAATYGEWLQGSGKGCNDFVCLFIGTGIGGGMVSNGNLLTGFSNTAGELGHIVVDKDGPQCTCGNRGCLEAYAGGWAIAKHAKELIKLNPQMGESLLNRVEGDIQKITAKVVFEAFREGCLLAQEVVRQAIQALIAGSISIVNAFNPERLIFGGGVILGFPAIIEAIETGIREGALKAATKDLQVMQARLGANAGIVGAGALARTIIDN